MKSFMLIGSKGSGKTTLVENLKSEELQKGPTQVVTYYDNIIDTPGLYLEGRMFLNSIITTSFNCDVIGLVEDATNGEQVFNPGFSQVFNGKEVIGIITKTDLKASNIERARENLKIAGVDKIFEISSKTQKGIEEIKEHLKVKKS